MDVLIELGWDSGPYPMYSEYSPEFPVRHKVVSIPEELWKAYEEAELRLMELQKQIGSRPAVTLE